MSQVCSPTGRLLNDFTRDRFRPIRLLFPVPWSARRRRIRGTVNSRRAGCSSQSIGGIPGYVATAGQSLGDKNDRFMPLSGVGSSRELAARIGRLLSSSPTTELKRLATVSDGDVALAAGWERVCRTVPAAEQDELVNPDAEAISRFLGLLKISATRRIFNGSPPLWSAGARSRSLSGGGRRTPENSSSSFIICCSPCAQRSFNGWLGPTGGR